MSDKPVFKPTEDSTTVLIVSEPKGPFDGKFGPQWPCDVSVDGKDMTWWIARQDLATEAKEWKGRKVIVKKVAKINESGQPYTKIEILGQAVMENDGSKLAPEKPSPKNNEEAYKNYWADQEKWMARCLYTATRATWAAAEALYPFPEEMTAEILDSVKKDRDRYVGVIDMQKLAAAMYIEWNRR